MLGVMPGLIQPHIRPQPSVIAGPVAATGTLTVCAVGPVGGRAHSPDEYLEIDTLVPRAQALALAVLRLR